MKRLLALTAALAALTAALAPPSPAAARSLGGPYAATHRWLSQDDARSFFVTFKADEIAWVEALADGDVDIEVYDEDGFQVDLDDRINPDALCIWYPDRTQTYEIVIVNADEKPLVFHMRTN